MDLNASQVMDEAQISFFLGTPDQPYTSGKKMVLSIHNQQSSDGNDNTITFNQTAKHSKITLFLSRQGSKVKDREAYILTDAIKQDEQAQKFIRKLCNFCDDNFCDGDFVKVNMIDIDKDGNRNQHSEGYESAIIGYNDIQSLCKLFVKKIKSDEPLIPKNLSNNSEKLNFYWKMITVPVGLIAVFCLWYFKFKKS
jgi:hypothetical protein